MFGTIKNILCVGLLLISTCSLLASAQREVFVNCGTFSGGVGTLTSPFSNIQDAVTALGPGGGIISVIPPSVCTGAKNRNITISHTNILIRPSTPGFITLINCEGSGVRAFIIDNAQFTLQSAGIQSCGNPTQDGGAIFIKNSFVTLDFSNFISNIASRGGAVFSQDASILLTTAHGNGAWFLNTATQPHGGGGLYILRTSVTANGLTSIISNTPDDIHCDNGSYTGTPPAPNTVVSCNACYVQSLSGANACPAA